MKICSIDGCDKEHSGKGFCKRHYDSFKKYGDPLEVERLSSIEKKKCSIEGCDSDHYGNGFCQKHNLRFRLYGDPNYNEEKRHGMTKTSEFIIWGGMKSRCHCKTASNYKMYGGRGITLCKSWNDSFIKFYKDMGKRPSDVHQIDRIDNNKGYSKDNCRWVTPAENVQNRRTTKLVKENIIEIRTRFKNGETGYKKFAEEFNVSIETIRLLVLRKTWKNISQ